MQLSTRSTEPSILSPRVPLELSPNHCKLLYLISLYAVAANSTKQNERWMRHVPLLVLMFEGIVRGKFDFDYAPASVRLSFRGNTLRRWINVSREGQAAIDDLWHGKYVNGLKLSSDDFQPITAYQVSMKGQLVLQQQLPLELKQAIDSIVYPPAPFDKRLLLVHYDGTHFQLKSGGYCVPSSITESEDVSYVSSPFLPGCLRSDGYYQLEARSNRDRAGECAIGVSSITKKTTEAITLGDVYALISEWVPFGSNQIVALNERMGALDRCQGGILTSVVDAAPTDTQFHVPVGQTQVRILDFDFVRFINFEAESHFPETSGIVQIESFGMHLNCDGSLIYGIKVEAIMDRKADDISIDHLSRLLVDVHQDSSMLVNDLLSRYQLSLLEMLYLGDSFQRNKYNCILAKQIQPKRSAHEYLTNISFANELAQVLGDIYASHDLSNDDVLVVGKAGCLFSGPNIFRYEHVFTAYVGLVCRDIFIKNFFARTFVLDATLKEIRLLIHRVQREPAIALQVREKLTIASKDTILLAETLEYLLDSLEEINVTPSIISLSTDDGMQPKEREALDNKLFQVLALQQLKQQTIMRCHDSIKLMENTMLQLEQLQMIAESTATNQLEVACQRIHGTTRALMKATALKDEKRFTLLALQYVVGGIFSFDVIDRLVGSSWDDRVPDWAVTALVNPLLQFPILWWVLNLLALGGFVSMLFLVSKIVMNRALGWCVIRAQLHRRFSLNKLERLLQHDGRIVLTMTQSQVLATPGHSTPTTRFRTIRWEEHDWNAWPGGACPHIELCYDEKHMLMLYVAMVFDGKKTVEREEAYLQRFHDILTHADVYLEAS